ncbi:hypothetical protein EV193_104235 [Herbihabitans rhizosphaerae]|uniref:Uncharacterized protein n=1 Tax=Herbihabitans rhizosphaerae TaxID=1872711 RepID=A0A4Q7KRA1_9PSEU|nr:hypothetical protein [Herbihabitans rhizosphaerae]RZS39024.1 hypothetical protein EV193_104235 [Herbihabitans rhizosphaerae]
MNAIVRLWRSGELPIDAGLYRADGESWSVRIEAGGLAVGEPVDLEAEVDADPDWVTEYDIWHEVALPEGGFLCCGDGSHGSDGFFARLDAQRELVWAVQLPEGNPFTDITLDGESATFRSTSEVTIAVDLASTEFTARRG